jgi:HlyD family secretion protein
MSNNRPPLPVIIILVLAIIGVGAYYFINQRQQVQAGILTASGTVESTEISIAPETSGKVVEVLVAEGDAVKAGDVLFRLDETLLQAQRNVAAAGLETAKSAAGTSEAAVATAQLQYDTVFNAAIVQGKSARTTDWYKGQPGEFTLPLWYYNQAEQIKAAQSEVDAASQALGEAETKLAAVQSRGLGADFVKAETDMAAAQAQYQVANDLHNRAMSGTNMDDLTKRQLFLLGRDAYLKSKGLDARWVTLTAGVNKELRDAAQDIYDDAKSALKDAQDTYADEISTDGAKDVMKARAQVSIAQERYYTGLDYLRLLQTGADSPAVTSAQKVLDQAKSVAAQATSAISQAEANLALIELQIRKLTVTAPADGIVLTRNIELGEVVNPGSVVLTVGKLADLTLTVYVPEDRYGEVQLGQAVTVTVDSFAGETFKATVIHIADQAEFTPRNVQTVEGRKTTVFAIKLKLEDPEGKLKPGMPADVTFPAKAK